MARPLILRCLVIGLVVIAAGCSSTSEPSGPPPPTDQQVFSSPEAAVAALVDALRQDSEAQLIQILGPEGDDIISSGDSVADRADAARFVALYDEKHSVQAEDSGARTLIVGHDAWPFPVPIVASDGKFFFDTETGREEILNRRIGRNELETQQVCLAIADAQRDYVAMNPMGRELPEYAAKLVSDAGMKNGLYWPTTAAEQPSPLGPLVASAAAEGYGSTTATATPATQPARTAFHGYRYRLLTAQGPHASGGELTYLVNGHLIGGFAVVAYPAQYGNSGIMTFIMNHDGVVYERDLGPQTEQLAESMKVFDPDPTWTKVSDAIPVAQSK